MQKQKGNKKPKQTRIVSEERKSVGKKSEQKRQMKAVARGCILAAATVLALLCLFAWMMSAGKLPLWAGKAVGLAVGCIAAAAAAFFCARYSGKNGFVLGFICAAILFCLAFFLSLAMGDTPQMWAAVKLFSMLICGCVFGSVGVNMKKRG